MDNTSKQTLRTVVTIGVVLTLLALMPKDFLRKLSMGEDEYWKREVKSISSYIKELESLNYTLQGDIRTSSASFESLKRDFQNGGLSSAEASQNARKIVDSEIESYRKFLTHNQTKIANLKKELAIAKQNL